MTWRIVYKIKKLNHVFCLHKSYSTTSLFPKPGDKVILGMSGGVDSSVSAYLLQQKGYDVEGVYMRNWDSRDEDSSPCPSLEDQQDVARVCEQLGIKWRLVDFSREYWIKVFAKALEEFEAGRTPNPDVACNREIKFGVLMERILGDGAWIATGHYARLDRSGQGVRLLRGSDRNKDQTYFLSTVPAPQLSRAIFPIGEMNKADVKALARKLGLATAGKRESMGICFVGNKRKFGDFIAEYIPQNPGPVKTHEGLLIGEHKGLFHYTIGQASRFCHGSSKWVVWRKDMSTNTLVVVPGTNHPLLFSKALVAGDWNWIGSPPSELDRDGDEMIVEAQVRYRQNAERARVIRRRDTSADRYEVRFEREVRGITPGQMVVVWRGEECLGAGVIDHVLDGG
ncbi:uncharacterized protein VTP21DRAFT_7473 [Calcarisporiella thermophila]|uniref:uncharacterized protein n=1 Tax=Calcarisporiella thermophila TaxID=911321 RepID=UPI003743D186